MKKRLPKILRYSFGVFFIILGIIGLILPLIPQIIFFIIGFGLLGWNIEKKAFKKLYKKIF